MTATAAPERKTKDSKDAKDAGVLLFSCPRSALAEALGKLASVLSGKMSLAILSCALVETDATGVTLTATDLDRRVSTRLAATASPGRIFCLPARRLNDIVATLPPAATVMVTGELGPVTGHDGQTVTRIVQITITAGRSRFVLAGFAPEDFPRMATPRSKVAATLSGPLLVEGLKRAVVHCATEESRPIYNGVLIDAGADGLDLFATQEHHGMRVRLASQPPFTGQFILNRIAVPIITKLFAEDEEVQMVADETGIGFEGAAGSLVVRLIAGPYPHYKPLLVMPCTRTARVARWEFVAAIRRVLAVSNDAVRVECTWRADELTLSADHAEAGRAADTIPIVYTADDTVTDPDSGYRCVINGKYILDVLESVGGDEVEVLMSAPERIIYVRDVAKKDGPTSADLGLCMPLRLLD